MKLIKNFPARSGLLLLLIFFAFSVGLIYKYIDTERQRDFANWHSRLGMLADLRRSAIETEINTRRKQLRELAENPSLQLYLSQASNAENSDASIMAAQQSHMRNLLAVTADRFGFNVRNDSPVNIATPLEYGLAVIDNQGKLLIASKSFSQSIAGINEHITQTLKTGEPGLIDLFSSTSSQPVYGFIMPVFHIQRVQFKQPVGAAIVLLDPRDGLFLQLLNKHIDTRSDETLLLRKQQNNVMFISPLQKDFTIFHQIPSNAQLAEAISAQQPGSFIRAMDYRGIDVIATTRSIYNTPWILLQKIDSAEALAESNQHQQFLLISLLLLTGFIGATFIAIWRHSTSNRLQRLATSLYSQTALLNAISDNIHDIIFLLDDNNNFVFANCSFTQIFNIPTTEITGRSLANVLGHDLANTFNNLEHAALPAVISLSLTHKNCNFHVSRAQLPQGQYHNAALYVLHDISELKAAQDKRDKLAQGIIDTLVKAVDLHDPYCTDHSSRTREVALCIATELKLDKTRRDALEMAAMLANIGKLFLPREILTKMDALSEGENDMLKWHIDYAVDILKQLDFAGPVVTIIAQKNEHLDGSGYPHGLKAVDILLESRILAVANAFVAMASARAYREGHPVNEVLGLLFQQCDHHYDRHVVAALFHIAENQADWRSWQTSRALTNKP